MADNDLPDWTTEMDKEILELLNTEMVLTPTVIAENIDRSRGAVARRMNALEAGGLVKKIDRGKYRISKEGLEMFLGGFQMITPDDGEEMVVAVRDRDEIIEEEGRHELTQEEYSIGVIGMFRRKLRESSDSDEPVELLREALDEAEKYYKVVEN
jgi:DNA-binding Lrp family transcriptional regulator